MAIERYETADGTQWRVRWREATGRKRSVTVPSKRDAVALDGDIKAKKFKGEALPRPTRDTLASAYDEWLRLRGPDLAPPTLAVYKYAWNAHIHGTGFDAHRLTDLLADPMLLDELRADLRDRGVGPAAQRKAITVLSAVLTQCVRWKRIPTNPVWRMPKPAAGRQRIPRPFPPLVVERIRLRLMRRRTRDDPKHIRGFGDATLVSLMSYAGLRPGEALALNWGDVGEHTLAIDKALADGTIGPTKTGAVRSVPITRSLIADLVGWRIFNGDPGDDELVFPGEDGPWSRSQSNNWRARVWRPVLADLAKEKRLAHLADAIPYDCRGSFVSLHLRAGASPLEVARWAGHSPQVMFRHYANVIDELEGEPRIPVEDQIARARDTVDDEPAEELDNLTVELYARPKVTASGREGAARKLYDPAA